ncbi:MAG: GIY-YIG nuclease family protein [Amphiplicatus sp.]
MKYDIYVYMLLCADGSYYVGSYRGADIETRVGEHNSAKHPSAYTATRRPARLVWCEYFLNADDAITMERRLKKWSRAKKEALIRGDEEGLKAYSRRGFRPAAILRDAGLRPAPQDEAVANFESASQDEAARNNLQPHPEEARSAVTKPHPEEARSAVTKDGRQALTSP